MTELQELEAKWEKNTLTERERDKLINLSAAIR